MQNRNKIAHAMEVNHLLLHQLHQQLMRQLPGYTPYCLSSQVMQLGHLQLHKKDVKMKRQEVHAISCLTAADLQMHRLLPQQFASFSGYHKFQWLRQTSVTMTNFSGDHKRQWLSQAMTNFTGYDKLHWL